MGAVFGDGEVQRFARKGCTIRAVDGPGEGRAVEGFVPIVGHPELGGHGLAAGVALFVSDVVDVLDPLDAN